MQVPSALNQYTVVNEGVNDGEAPEPANVPPHEPVYHFQIAPVPVVPPVKDTVLELPVHKPDGDDDNEEGITEDVLTVTVKLVQTVVLHVPCA